MSRHAAFAPYIPSLLTGRGRVTHRWSAEGTIVFCDVSGFTRMSERLAEIGRGGAEEVTAAIDRAFTALIDRVFLHGGDVLSFGGDALLCWFGGDEHAVAGLDAAGGMQRWMRREGREVTSRGPVRLRMSIGIASGSTDFELAGRESSELLVLGPTVDRALAVEGSAAPGEIRLDDSTAAAVPDRMIRRRGGCSVVDLHRLRRVEAKHERAPQRANGSDARFVLPALRTRLAEREHHSEHRPACVGFVRVRQDDGSRSPAESYELVEQIVERHGVNILGTDVDERGYKIVLAAGVPEALSRRRERVVASALEISTTLQCPTGVADGMVFAGDIGHQSRRTWTVMGDAVNTAARLAVAAEAGTALIHSEVAAEVGDRFGFGDAVDLTLKGKLGSVVAHPVTRSAGAVTRPTADLPFQGRDHELRRASDAPRPVEIVAPHGFGRTRFLVELVTASPGAVWCTGTPSNAHRGWSTIAPLLRWLAERPQTIDEADETLISAVLGVGAIDERLDMASMVPRIVVALTSAFHRENVAPLVVVDDVHWVDAPSAGVLEGIARDGADIVVSRTTGAPPAFAGLTTIDLEPLDDAAIERIAVASARRPLSDHALGEIVSLASGVPQHAIALAMYRGDELPQSIEELRTTALDKLSSRDRFRLRVAAVGGFFVDTSMLFIVTGDDAWLANATLEALDAFLTPSADGWHFRHETDRQVAYLGMPVRTRRRLHNDIAHHLASVPDDAAIVVMHAIEGGDTALCASMGARAATQAAQRGAWHEAHRFAVAAAEATTVRTAELSAWRVAADAAEHSGRPDQAEDALRKAISLSTGALDRALLWSRRARVARRADRLSLSLRWCTMGLNALDELVADEDRESTDSAAIELYLERAATLLFQERLAPATESVNSARKRLGEIADDNDRAQILILDEMLYSASSDGAAAQRAAEEAIPLLLANGDTLDAATVLVNRGAERGEAGDWSTAVEFLDRSRELFRQIGHVVGEMIATSNLSGILLDQGRVDDAQRAFERIERIAGAAHRPDLAAFAEASLGRIAAWRGDIAGADQRIAQALSRRVAGGDRSLRVWMRLFHAEAAAIGGNRQQLRERLALVASHEVAHLPAARVAHLRFAALLEPFPVESLRTALEAARAESIAVEVVQAIRWLAVVGDATPNEQDEARRHAERLQIAAPAPLPSALLNACRKDVR